MANTKVNKKSKKKKAILPRGFSYHGSGVQYRKHLDNSPKQYDYVSSDNSDLPCAVDECYSKMRILQEAYDKEIRVDAEKMTLDDWYREWMLEREGTVEASTVYTGDEQQYGYVKPYLGEKKIKDLKKADILLLRRELQHDGRKLANGKKGRALMTETVNKAVHKLRQMLDAAVDSKILTENPCRGIKDLKRRQDEAEVRDTIHRGLTQEQQKMFLRYTESVSPFWFNLFDFWMNTGLRVGEVCALTQTDIDERNIHITKAMGRSGHSVFYIKDPKNKASVRDIPLNDHLRAVLLKQREQQKTLGFSEFLIFTNTEGERVTRGAVNHAIKKVCDAIQKDGIEFEKITSHAFRATFATRAVEKGVPVTTLQKLLGHSKIETTMKYYVHIPDESKVRAMQILNEEEKCEVSDPAVWEEKKA